MPPKTDIKSWSLHAANQAIRQATEEATTPEEIGAVWQTLRCPARDALSLMYFRKLVRENQAENGAPKHQRLSRDGSGVAQCYPGN